MKINKSMVMAVFAAIGIATVANAGQFDLYNRIAELRKNSTIEKAREEAVAELNAITNDQWLEYADQLAATNKILFLADGKKRMIDYGAGYGSKGLFQKIDSISHEKHGDSRLCGEYDAKFVDAGLMDRGLYQWQYFKFHGLQNAYVAFHTNSVNAYPLARARYAISEKRFIEDGRQETIPEKLNCLVEIAATGVWNESMISSNLRLACRYAVLPIKRKIREDGGTFVIGEDGVNPVQDAIDALTTAFQSPKCSGVKEWVAHWFPDYQWIDIDDYFLSDDALAELKDKVYYGEVDLDDRIATKMCFAMGIDEYNKFIKSYNGNK